MSVKTLVNFEKSIWEKKMKFKQIQIFSFKKFISFKKKFFLKFSKNNLSSVEPGTVVWYMMDVHPNVRNAQNVYSRTQSVSEHRQTYLGPATDY